MLAIQCVGHINHWSCQPETAVAPPSAPVLDRIPSCTITATPTGWPYTPHAAALVVNPQQKPLTGPHHGHTHWGDPCPLMQHLHSHLRPYSPPPLPAPWYRTNSVAVRSSSRIPAHAGCPAAAAPRLRLNNHPLLLAITTPHRSPTRPSCHLSAPAGCPAAAAAH
jgi:hypothetical protein